MAPALMFPRVVRSKSFVALRPELTRMEVHPYTNKKPVLKKYGKKKAGMLRTGLVNAFLASKLSGSFKVDDPVHPDL